jgi:hypothetical protein
MAIGPGEESFDDSLYGEEYLSEVLNEFPPEVVEAYIGKRGRRTPSESATSDLRQLMAMQALMRGDVGGEARPLWTDPVARAQGIKDLTMGGGNDPSRYAYGPTKAGPFVFFPSQPPPPNNAGINTSLLATGLTNVLDSYLNQRGGGKPRA